MKMLKYAAAAALATATLGGTAQAAQIVTTGPNATTVMGTLEAGANNDFSIGFSDANLANPFSELLTFTTDAAGLLSINFGSTLTSARNDVDFSEAFLTGTGIVGQIAIPQILGDPNETRALNGLNIGQGTYTITIRGTPGTESGSLGGTVAFQSVAAAVPEPGTWAMMLLGFGAVGFSMRRRRQGSHLAQVA